MKSPDGEIKQYNNNLYPWRRSRTLPRMPEQYLISNPVIVSSTSTKAYQNNNNINQHSARQQQHDEIIIGSKSPAITPSIDFNWAPHPSKIPIPPPRRKKRLFLSGLKDSFRKLVNPSQHLPKHKEEPEPIYATIFKPSQQVPQQQLQYSNILNPALSSSLTNIKVILCIFCFFLY